MNQSSLKEQRIGVQNSGGILGTHEFWNRWGQSN